MCYGLGQPKPPLHKEAHFLKPSSTAKQDEAQQAKSKLADQIFGGL
jgi:hypothetical protein